MQGLALVAEDGPDRVETPPQSANQYDQAGGRVALDRMARDVAEFHRKGLRRRMLTDLTREMYLVHIDAEGDGQWAAIYGGARVAIPLSLTGGPRVQSNLLRPLVDNAIAYHTTMPFRFSVPVGLSHATRDTALVDQALANYLASEQDWNGLMAEALYLAMAYGHCPVHAYWRDDVTEDLFEPAGYGAGAGMGASEGGGMLGGDVLAMPKHGMIDCWAGDPWDTVYHTGATRNNVQAFTYGRTLPADLVRQAFAHMPWIDELDGSRHMPSASRFQQVSRKWRDETREMHGSATIYGAEHDAELVALVCRETAPGIDPDWPDGRLEVVALQGTGTTDESGMHGRSHRALPLHLGPLPGRTFSAVRLYSHHRFDDVLGKPWVADLDDLQVQLNQLETMENEYIRRSNNPPWVTPHDTELETTIWANDTHLEVDPNARTRPYFMNPPSDHIQLIEQKIERVKADMWLIGGYQAASRGESHAGDSGRKVLALARADDTVHGPTNQRFRRAVESFARISWRLFKEFGDAPMVLDALGDEVGYLADGYVDRTRLSDRAPHYRLVSGYGVTPEAKGEQLLQLATTRGADGVPLMETRQFRSAWPDPETFGDQDDPQTLRERRPKAINEQIRKLARQITQADQRIGRIPLQHPAMQQVALQLNMQLDMQFPVLMDDDIQAHLKTLSMLTQDETELPLARALAGVRQAMYYRWLAQQQAQTQTQAPPAGAQAAGPAGGGQHALTGASGLDVAGSATSSGLEHAAREEPANTF
ncbi:hypothetical protein [Candidatus Palauibacter sp.]|uniref:portal protein n=1 Tax=Candidatus Palauibacter sp. TaxID=3101350 RepID=UPI003CC57D55